MLNSCRSRRKKRCLQNIESAGSVMCSTPAGVAEKNAPKTPRNTPLALCAQLLPESQKKTRHTTDGDIPKGNVLNSCRSRRKKRVWEWQKRGMLHLRSTPAGVAEKNADNEMRRIVAKTQCSTPAGVAEKKRLCSAARLVRASRVLNSCRSRRKKRPRGTRPSTCLPYCAQRCRAG